MADENDWSDLVVPEVKPPTLGEGTPVISPETMAERRRLRQAWNRRPRTQRLRIGAQDIASAFPVAGPLIQPSEQESQEFEETNPATRRFGRAAVHTAPYAAAGVGLPALFSTIPRAMAAGGFVEGADAAARGQDVAPAAVSGAISGIPGNLLGRAITPLPRARAFDLQATESSNALRAMAEAMGRQSGRRASGQFARRSTPEETEEAMREAVSPAVRLSNLSDTASVRLEQMARWGLGGASTGYMVGRPIEGALIGALAPVAARTATRAGNAAINAANRALETRPGRAVSKVARGYKSNTALSDEMKALISAIGIPFTQESPELSKIIGP